MKEPEIPRSRSDRPMLAMARRSAIADLLRDSGAVTVTEVQSRFGISPMTARRDLDVLAAARRRPPHARRRGAAVDRRARALVRQRLEVAPEAKARLAEAAFALLHRARRCSWTRRRRVLPRAPDRRRGLALG